MLSRRRRGIPIGGGHSWGGFGSIIFFNVWVLIPFWPDRVATRIGHGFLPYFLFRLVFFHAALTVDDMVRDRTVMG